MRIAIINWTRLRTGGVETYLGDVMAELARRGHESAFWHESDEPGVWEHTPLPDGVPAWWAEEIGRPLAIRQLRDWRPDLLYVHIVNDLETEAELLEVAPAVYFAHGHFGTCISGSKACQLPTPAPCHRQFGWKCLLHYYPRRCGGLNPVTMWRDYRRQTRLCPPLKHRFSRQPFVGGHRIAFNADRLLNRMWDYPRYLRSRVGDFHCFHVGDHSCAQLVHELPAERTGCYGRGEHPPSIRGFSRQRGTHGRRTPERCSRPISGSRFPPQSFSGEPEATQVPFRETTSAGRGTFVPAPGLTKCRDLRALHSWEMVRWPESC